VGVAVLPVFGWMPGGEDVKSENAGKVEMISAYISLMSEVLYLAIGLVVLKILITFAGNFGELIKLAGGM